MRGPAKILLTSLLTISILPACGDPGRPLSPGARLDGGGGGGGGAGEPAAATLENVQAIYDARCAGSTCHIGNQYPQMGLDLSPGTAFRTHDRRRRELRLAELHHDRRGHELRGQRPSARPGLLLRRACA